MNYEYSIKLSFSEYNPFDINQAIKCASDFRNKKILIEVPNTKGMNSKDIKRLPDNVAIRIAGGYDKERVERRKDWKFKNGETGEYYTNAVIYSKNETIKILEQLESLESGMNAKWSDIQKVIYIYDKLRNNIMYDPKYERKYSSEIRSLRGLMSRETVCAGYAMIFKECMDRLGITCDYVEGYIHANKEGGHAWNIIKLNGKFYPIDLTWDNENFRRGHHNSFEWLTKSPEEFAENHRPVNGEKIMDYKRSLSSFNPKIIKRIFDQIGTGRNKTYYKSTYTGKQKDGKRFIISQLGDCEMKGTIYYRYYFAYLRDDGYQEYPRILFSSTNVSHLIDAKNFGREIPEGYEDALCNILFSEENIRNSIENNTYFIGGLKVENMKTLTKKPSDIQKDKEISKELNYETHLVTRSDGSKFMIQQMNKIPHVVNGINLYRYDIFELVQKNNDIGVPKRTTIYTEQDLFREKSQPIVDVLLSKERIDRKVNEAGGYVGYLDKNGTPTYHEELKDTFTPNVKVELDGNNGINIQKIVSSRPSIRLGGSKSIVIR